MATLRTPEEREKIAEKCIQLEKEGGDILEYLRSEGYISPRATWRNIQREKLGRRQIDYTNGRPMKKKEGGAMNEKTMEARLKRLESLKEQIIDGVGVRAALSSMGYTGKSAGQTYRQIRAFAKEHDPEFYARLPEKISDSDAPVSMSDTDKPAVKIDGGIRIETKAKSEIEIVEKPPEFPCVESRAEEDDRLKVIAVRDRMIGDFRIQWGSEIVTWESRRHGLRISLATDEWKRMAEKLPEILEKLGR